MNIDDQPPPVRSNLTLFDHKFRYSPNIYDFISPDHFTANLGWEAQRSLFIRSVHHITLEVASYCNRKCWFCPNSIEDRRGANKILPEELYLSILRQLAEVDYRGDISFSQYGEPLAKKKLILKRVRQAREYLPNALMRSNTNGDFIKDRSYIEELGSAGLDHLFIQVYLGAQVRWDYLKATKLVARKLEMLGLPYELLVKDKNVIEYRLEVESMRVHLRARNFAVDGNSRGGSVDINKSYVRSSPCLAPHTMFTVGFDGLVTPCCNLRSDLPAHAESILWNLNEDSDIFAAYASARFIEWRKALSNFNCKTGFCSACTDFLLPEDDSAHDALYMKSQANTKLR